MIVVGRTNIVRIYVMNNTRINIRIYQFCDNKGFKSVYVTYNLPFTVVDTVVAFTVKMIKYRFLYTFGIF